MQGRTGQLAGAAYASRSVARWATWAKISAGRSVAPLGVNSTWATLAPRCTIAERTVTGSPDSTCRVRVHVAPRKSATSPKVVASTTEAARLFCGHVLTEAWTWSTNALAASTVGNVPTVSTRPNVLASPWASGSRKIRVEAVPPAAPKSARSQAVAAGLVEAPSASARPHTELMPVIAGRSMTPRKPGSSGSGGGSAGVTVRSASHCPPLSRQICWKDALTVAANSSIGRLSAPSVSWTTVDVTVPDHPSPTV